MSFNLIFKKNLKPVKQFDKIFDGTTVSVDVLVKDPTNVFEPTFTIQTDADLSQYNYIDGSAFSGRQYFITACRSVGYQRYEVDAKTDVLSTWATQIRGNTAVIRRQEGKYNLYLDDPEFHVYNTEQISTYRFPANTFNKSLSYVLVMNGSNLNSSQIEKREEVEMNELSA